MKKKSFSQILYLTKRAHPFFESRMGAITNQIGLTPQEGHILLFLANNPDCNHACDAVVYRGLSKSYVSKALTSLSKKGLIVFQEDTSDHRYQKIVFTETAQEKVKVLQEGQKALFKELILSLRVCFFSCKREISLSILLFFVIIPSGDKNSSIN